MFKTTLFTPGIGNTLKKVKRLYGIIVLLVVLVCFLFYVVQRKSILPSQTSISKIRYIARIESTSSLRPLEMFTDPPRKTKLTSSYTKSGRTIEKKISSSTRLKPVIPTRASSPLTSTSSSKISSSRTATTKASQPTTATTNNNKNDNTDNPQASCPFLNVDPFDPAAQMHVHLDKKRPIDCSKGLKSLIYLDEEMIRVNFTKVKQTVGQIDYCRYTPLKLSDRSDSDLQSYNWSRQFLKEPLKLSPKDEHLLVECYSNDTLVGETYKSRIIEKPERERKHQDDYKRHMKEASPSETMNVLIVGMDGMSKQNLIRTMPKTRNYIIDHLNARELNKFNKVGDNTFPNVLVLHSGHSEEEVRKRWDEKQYFDVVEDMFLWHHYQKAGYRTAMVLDVTYITAYHYLKKGWQHPTFDYYIRPLTYHMDKTEKRSQNIEKGNCVDDVPKVVILQDYLLQLTSKFKGRKGKPYFAYSFFTDLTHYDQDEARRADDIYFNFFKQLKETNVLNNTLVLFFSDHGTRFYSFRHTINGKIEVNTPYVFFMFPPWFEKKYPEAMNTFGINQNRLTTFFDLNKTLMDLLKFKGKTKKGSVTSRAISLFDEIPKERTCVHAAIPMDYCNCKLMSNDTIPPKLSENISNELLRFITEKTSNDRNICAQLSLKKVYSVIAITTNEKSNDTSYYQTTIETTPGGAVYEALMKYDVTSRKASLVGNIVRLNLYRGQDSCVETLDLKPYCFCKS